VDAFWEWFELLWERELLASGKRHRRRAMRLHPAEILTILIFFQQSGYRAFKGFYTRQVQTQLYPDIPRLVSCTRFVELMPRFLVLLAVYLQTQPGACTEISFIDSTSLAACHPARIQQQRVFRVDARRGKTSVGWFYGFTLHLVVNDRGELHAFCLTPGNTDGQTPVPRLVLRLFGRLFGYKCYVSARSPTSHDLRLSDSAYIVAPQMLYGRCAAPPRLLCSGYTCHGARRHGGIPGARDNWERCADRYCTSPRVSTNACKVTTLAEQSRAEARVKVPRQTSAGFTAHLSPTWHRMGLQQRWDASAEHEASLPKSLTRLWPQYTEAGVPADAGQPLPTSIGSRFEVHFGHDFSRVRVHADTAAADAARSLGARAYALGTDLVFGAGEYAPDTARGQRLLAHELAHVAQQHVTVPSKSMGTRDDPDEVQAERAVAGLSWGAQANAYGAVALDATWHSTPRPLPVMPALSAAGARIQRVQLTYDDGPDSAGNTRAVLTALNAAGARATFYLVGKRVAQGDNWRIVFDIAAAGHWLGNHAYDWNDVTDNHIFLHGTVEERAQKILQAEWAIRDALIQGRDDAKKRNTWGTIPQANRDYIEDVIAHGTGRFRTPGFKSHLWTNEGVSTSAAIASVNQVLSASGLRPLATTEVSSWGVTHEGVTVDPQDYEQGRTQSEIESKVKGKLSSNDDSILLHSRIAASVAATPAIVADIKSRKWSFDPTIQGALGDVRPKPGFADLATISNPPTSAEIATARTFFKTHRLSMGPVFAGSVAIGIFQLAQQAGPAEVSAFAAEIKSTTVTTPEGTMPLANWLNASEEWRLFSLFFENWAAVKPFPRIKGVTL
jgi:hypothetical protein